jgi:hypothetical protein
MQSVVETEANRMQELSTKQQDFDKQRDAPPNASQSFGGKQILVCLQWLIAMTSAAPLGAMLSANTLKAFMPLFSLNLKEELIQDAQVEILENLVSLR